MHKKILSIILTILLIVPVGNVFAEDLGVPTPAPEASQSLEISPSSTAYTVSAIPEQQGVDLAIESTFPEYNVPVTLVATPQGDPSLAGQAEYRYVYLYGSSWSVIREWDDSNTCEWTPPKVGTYTIYVYTRTKGRTTKRDTMDHIQYYASDITRQTGVTLTTDKPPVQEAGTEITLTAQNGSSDPALAARAEYQFRYKLGSQWTTLKDWSGENACTWTPNTKGAYTLYVYTRTAGRSGYDAYDTYTYDVDIEPLTGVSLTTDRATPQQAGTAITLTAAAEGRHAGSAEYLFRVNDGSSWRTIKDWSGEPTCTWTPQNESMCTIEVQARAAGRSGADQTATIENYFVYTGSLPVAGLDVTVSPDSPQEYDTPVRIQAQAAGESADGSEEYQYRVQSGSNWSTLSPWSTAKDITWTPPSPGSYTIEVRTRAAGRSGYDAIYTAAYTIRDVPVQQGVDLAIESTFPEYNVPVTLVATPHGDPSLSGRAEYRYVYLYGSSWSVIREWDDSNTCEWTPPKVGTYTVYVYTRTKGRTTNRDAMDHIQYYATDITRQTGVTLTTDKPPVQEAGTEITLTAQPATDNEELKARAEYQFRYKLGNQWTTLKDWSGENTCTWTPDTKGAYTLYVYTRTAGRSGYDAYDTYTYDVDIEPLAGVTLTTDRTTPQQAGTAITLTAAAEGRHADSAEYLFRVKDGLLWRTLKNWSSEPTCTWTPPNESMCTVEVQARAAGRNGADQAATIENYFVYTGSLPVAGLDVTVSPDSPQEYGTPVRILAQATGDSADGTEEYQVRVKNGLLWSTLSPWSTAKDITWTPSKPGDYAIEIRTRAAGRSGHDAIYTDTYTVTDILEQQGVALSTDMVEGQEYGTNVTLTAMPQGDPSLAGRAEYRYIYQYGGKWAVLQEWTDSSTLVWNPPNKGTYDLRVYTRTKGRTSNYDTYDTITCTFADIPKQSGVTLSTDIEPVQEPGTTVNLTWHTTETDPTVAARAEYQVQCLIGGTWSVLVDWGTDTAYAWTPDACGEHTLRVYTRTAAASRSGYDCYASKSYTIDTTPLTGVTLTADPKSPVEPETPVTFTATAAGLHAAQAEYRFTMYNGSSWYAVRNGEWSTLNSFDLRPSYPLYTIKVEARAPGSTTTDVSCTISFRVGTGGDYTDYTYSANTMAMIQYQNGGAVKSSGSNWVPASQSDILHYVDPDNWMDGQYKYQFLSLNYISGISASELNAILSDNPQNGGVLRGKGSVFLAAAQQYDINPAYLVSHAMLETGNGTSALATGIVVNGKTVYNMYGILAYDSNPNYYGSQYAYEKGWFSVDAAITGGAKWISDNYINRSSGRQNTLYAMRWNPNAIQKQIDSGDSTPTPSHQYATDIAWAVKQVSRLKSLMDRCASAVLEFIIPNYK